jgi:hypothetical protein
LEVISQSAQCGTVNAKAVSHPKKTSETIIHSPHVVKAVAECEYVSRRIFDDPSVKAE